MSAPQPILDYLKALDEYQRGLSGAAPPPTPPPDKPGTPKPVNPKRLIQLGYHWVYEIDEAIVFHSGLDIDADGAPKCYHPAGEPGLDYLANAGHPGDWWGVATDSRGNPIIQGEDDPAPGFYVSTTSLQNPAFKPSEQRRYMDSTSMPFIVLPGHIGLGIKLGDLGMCYNCKTGDNAFMIYADVGPRTHLGEGSIALADDLKINSDPKTGGTANGVFTVVFPGSSKGYQAYTEFVPQIHELFTKWGGLDRVKLAIKAIL